MRDSPAALSVTEIMIGVVLLATFVLVLFSASMVLPGRIVEGALLSDGRRERYRLNGLTLFLCVSTAVGLVSMGRPTALVVIYRHFWGLFAAANGIGFLLPAVLCLRQRARAQERGQAPGRVGRDVRRALSDYFYGIELNPKIAGVDLKMFSYRPSLIGLGLINAALAAEQVHAYGALAPRMVLYQALYFVYLANYFQFEYGMLHTWDIIAERFGWMLAWGDYVLVPFFYSVPAWYLIDDTRPLKRAEAAGLVILYLVGLVLFRGSNEQKHRFKTDPSARIWGRPAEALGGKLLVSGFWGIGRKLNYTGELCLYWAWTLTTGFGSVIPYLLPLWLTAFLPHRAWRDERRCEKKYGPLWKEYCRRARFRMIPFLY